MIVTFELPPNKRIVPELVELTLTLPIIEDIDVFARIILSGVPPTSSLLEIVRFDCAVLSNMEAFKCPLDLFLSIVALQRPKLVSMPFPEPGPVLLLF